MRIKSIEVIGATNRNVYAIGYTINGKKLTEIRLEERFIMSLESPQYVGFNEDGLILFTTEYEAEKLVKIFNTVIPKDDFSEYKVDYEYYIDEAYKIIHLIDGTTERLETERRDQREREKREREEANFIKFCVDKVPTKRQYELYGKEWLIEKWGERETK